MVGPTVQAMYHPWRALRSRPHLRLQVADLPFDVNGVIRSDGTILLARDLLQVERRCTILHELVHDERGIPHGYDPREELAVEQEVARRLIPLERLVDVARWTDCPVEAADALWVTEDLLRVRVQHLHPAERHAVARAVEGRDLNAGE